MAPQTPGSRRRRVIANTAAPAAARIGGLAARYRLEDVAVDKLRTLAELLGRDPHAPTAIREQIRVLDDHIADSLVALKIDAIRAAGSIADIGAGAGLPGLVLAIALPDVEFALIDSGARKVEFIRAAIAACALGNARALHLRVESWTEGQSSFDIVTARAVGRLDVIAEYAAPLMKVGGTLVAWRGRRDAAVEMQAQVAAARLGLRVEEPVHVCPYAEAEHRHLHLLRKVSETPRCFPRRPGVARKRPLGGPGRPAGAHDGREQTSDRARR